jgi:hypothetical protein
MDRWPRASLDVAKDRKHDIKLSLYLTNVIKAYGEVAEQIHVFFASELVTGEWTASRRGRFTPEGIAAGTHWLERCVRPRRGLDDTDGVCMDGVDAADSGWGVSDELL